MVIRHGINRLHLKLFMFSILFFVIPFFGVIIENNYELKIIDIKSPKVNVLNSEEMSPFLYNNRNILLETDVGAVDEFNYTNSVMYNITSGKEIRIPRSPALQKSELPIFPSTPPNVGLLAEKDNFTYDQFPPKDYFSPQTVFEPDDRQRVTPTTSLPWRTICKLQITADDGSILYGSGVIIDEFHVLTCGHCVFLHDHGGWAKRIKVIPGLSGGIEWYGHAWAKLMRSYMAWTISQDSQHDWAVITLDRNIGAYTGWMGRQTADSSNSIYTDILNMAGYPLGLDNGVNLYYDSDNGDGADQYNHWYYMDATDGQSGSPIWININGSSYIISIHTNNGGTRNMGVRLDQEKFDQIIAWLNIDAGIPPEDYPDMADMGEPFAGFSPKLVKSGEEFSIWCDIRNIGTVETDSITISYYASSDKTITTNDYLIGNDNITSITPYTYTTSSWSGLFPEGVPRGRYYIGWIIDGTNLTKELNEDNNRGVISSYQLLLGMLPSTVIAAIFILGFIAATVIGNKINRETSELIILNEDTIIHVVKP